MAAIGPDLPPHLLAKRKRREQDAEPTISVKLPSAEEDLQEASAEKRRRVVGPAPPPAPLDERPSEPAEASDSSSDDDFGPSLATEGVDKTTEDDGSSTSANPTAQTAGETKATRDEWMTMAPKQDDLAARMDPSRQRARGFNTGRSARGGGSTGRTDDASAWHETAEQKQKRLADQVLGISASSHDADSSRAHAKGSDKASRAKQKTETKARGPSLLEQHRLHKPEEAEEDDPSKRGFDYEKDMAIGASGAQKREMLNKATGYSSRFSGGSYL